jgi:predicted nuclease of restriction endonuclease-like (RecB) superfamily
MRSTLYQRIRQILESARLGVARTVNTTQVCANWLIGREIVEQEQLGKRRAGYGERLIASLSAQITREFGSGYSVNNLEHFRNFYITYPKLVTTPISHAPRGELRVTEKSHALRGKSPAPLAAATAMLTVSEILQAPGKESWQPGRLHPNLSWTHYRTLLRVDLPEARAFYEIEAIRNNWSARELERQINSLLFERLSKSKDKAGLMKLATKGHEVQQAVDIFKDPVVIEFLGLPESSRLVESELEEALINHLQAFLLELGKGFAFVSRQERLTIDGDHFYIDLVFYHTILKCYVLIDLKIGKLTHQDLGQLQLYVNYYDQERRTLGDNPTLGLILCTDKNDAVVRYTLGPDQQQKIFASRYKLHLPTEAELKTELQRELKLIERIAQK